MKKYIPYGHQYVDENDIQEVVEALRSDFLTQGSRVDSFEKALAAYCNAKYAVAVSSGTAALHIAYQAAHVQEGGEVITTPLTFAATASMLFACGAKPVFVDIDPTTLNIDPAQIERKITKKTKAIVVVDFAGNPCDYQRILAIAKKHNLLIIEDACHALGSAYGTKKVGSLSDMTIFSFHPVKHITTGEGGAVVTNNKVFYENLKRLRSHGIIKKPHKGGWYYEIKAIGFNYRITDFQCALGQSQLKKINMFIKKRRALVKKYNEAFKDMAEIILPSEQSGAKSSWHIYPIQLKTLNRKKVFDALRSKGLGVQVHYMPLHMHPFYKKQFGYAKGDFPSAEKYYSRAITLPLFPAMSKEEFDYVVTMVKDVIYKLSR